MTAISISPVLPPLQIPSGSINGRRVSLAAPSLLRTPSSQATPTSSTRSSKQQPPVPPLPTNQIHIATASIDGHVCVSSLVDPKDVTLRNFARPVQAVALSPDYKNDRSYLSGGLAGNLILTVGGKAGVSADANTNSSAASAASWLGSIGLSQNTGKDTILHSGEGSISTIKFSTSTRFVAWVNEHGIKIMRSNLKLDAADSDSAWKRIAHVDRPRRNIWDDMCSVWKARIEWVDDKSLETDDYPAPTLNGSHAEKDVPGEPQSKKKRRSEKLVVGWGDTAWVLDVHLGGTGVGKHAGERSAGSADILQKYVVLTLAHFAHNADATTQVHFRRLRCFWIIAVFSFAACRSCLSNSGRQRQPHTVFAHCFAAERKALSPDWSPAGASVDQRHVWRGG